MHAAYSENLGYTVHAYNSPLKKKIVTFSSISLM